MNSIDHTQGDRTTKQIIIGTLCLIALLVTLTVCYLAINVAKIPVEIDRAFTAIVSLLGGALIKTGIDQVTKPREFGDAVVQASKEEPIAVEGKEDSGESNTGVLE